MRCLKRLEPKPMRCLRLELAPTHCQRLLEPEPTHCRKLLELTHCRGLLEPELTHWRRLEPALTPWCCHRLVMPAPALLAMALPVMVLLVSVLALALALLRSLLRSLILALLVQAPVLAPPVPWRHSGQRNCQGQALHRS